MFSKCMSVQGTYLLKLSERSLSASNGSNAIRLEISTIFLYNSTADAVQMRHICRNSSVIIYNFEYENVVQRNGKQLLLLRYLREKFERDVAQFRIGCDR